MNNPRFHRGLFIYGSFRACIINVIDNYVLIIKQPVSINICTVNHMMCIKGDQTLGKVRGGIMLLFRPLNSVNKLLYFVKF
jgi:hypothetical protein